MFKRLEIKAGAFELALAGCGRPGKKFIDTVKTEGKHYAEQRCSGIKKTLVSAER